MIKRLYFFLYLVFTIEKITKNHTAKMSQTKSDQITADQSREDALSKSKIEVIKNLIFGENIQAYDEEFETLKKNILDKKKALEVLIEEVRTDLHKSVDDISVDVHLRITELEEKLESKIETLEEETLDKELLGTLFVQIGERILGK